MSVGKNQHFVPQYHFRQFSTDGKHIHILLMRTGETRLNGKIRQQSASPNLYGELESAISRLEAVHSAVIRDLISDAKDRDFRDFSEEHFDMLLQCIVLQRYRTILEAKKGTPTVDLIWLEAFKQHLRSLPDKEFSEKAIATVDRGEFTLEWKRSQQVLLKISAAIEEAPLLRDLHFNVLYNHTDRPFIFSDSPVVFYNTYYRKVTHRCVLGLQTPGLQVFFPITSRLQVMLIDRSVYDGPFRNVTLCDLRSRRDIDQLNALQLHHSDKVVYFSEEQSAGYLEWLWKNFNGSTAKAPRRELRKVPREWLLDNMPAPDGLLLDMEPQVSHELHLSFVTCNPIDGMDYVFKRRTPKVAKEHLRRAERKMKQWKNRRHH